MWGLDGVREVGKRSNECGFAVPAVGVVQDSRSNVCLPEVDVGVMAGFQASSGAGSKTTFLHTCGRSVLLELSLAFFVAVVGLLVC